MAESTVEVGRALDARDVAIGQAEWSARYIEFATRAAGRTARIHDLSRQILIRVSHGQLSPAVLQESLSGFVRAHGDEYANRLSALTGRFFISLVHAGVGVPDDASTDPTDWFQQLADYAGRVNAQRAHRAASVVELRLTEHLRHLLRVYFELLNDLTELRTRYEEEYLLRVLATADGSDEGTPLVLRLVAPLGETTSASLTLENAKHERIAIRCAVTDVRRADGVGPAFSSRIAIVPDAFALDPGEEARVGLSLQLDPASYEPDAPYVGALQVTRHGDPRLDVPIHIIATSRAERAESIEGAQ
jgi:hypothetical protein